MSIEGYGRTLFSTELERKLNPEYILEFVCLGFLDPQVDVHIFLNVFDLSSCVLEGPGPENERCPFLEIQDHSYRLYSFLRSEYFQFDIVFIVTAGSYLFSLEKKI